ncbi:transposase, partial [Saccharothrix sp. MB29]|nr:transposase [Saccharothrix sp. MB29]
MSLRCQASSVPGAPVRPGRSSSPPRPRASSRRTSSTQQARNLAADLGTRTESLCFLLRDRDGKYGQTFDAVFLADDLRVIKSAPQAPRMNAHCERVIGAIRRELLDHILIMGETRARQVLTTCEDHYNRHRPHQVRDQLPPETQH